MRAFVRRSFVLLAAAATFGVSVDARAAITFTTPYQLTMPAGYSSVSFSGNQTASDGQIVGTGVGTATGGNTHAVMWNFAGAFIVQNGAAYTATEGLGGEDGWQVGRGFGTATGGTANHALRWHSDANATDLHPTGFTNSTATAILVRGGSSNSVVGYGAKTSDGDRIHALNWSSGTSSAIDMHPATGYTSTRAFAVGFLQVAGDAQTTTGEQHAVVWLNGTSSGFRDMHPDGYTSSFAGANDQQSEGGWAVTASGERHAMRWTAGFSAINSFDLHPTALPDVFTSSQVTDVFGSSQVGWGHTAAGDHALFWGNTAASAIDLHTALGAGWVNSYVYGVRNDKAFGYAQKTNGDRFAVIWTVPEPSSAAVGLIALSGFIMRRRLRRVTQGV